MNTPLELASTTAKLSEYIAVVGPGIEQGLLEHLPLLPDNNYKVFNDALRYALFPGGKRLRPILTLLGAEIIGGHAQNVLTPAVAVEYIHNSSLIFDDLPCMDNATKRRGRSSLHIEYGEGPAVLVALALMNASYGLILGGTPLSCAIQAHRELVEGVGARGMIAGQYLDLTASRVSAAASNDLEALDKARSLKTSALICIALRIGAIFSGAAQGQLTTLLRFGSLLGDAFQIGDDIIDLKEDVGPFAQPATFAGNQRTKDARVHVASLIAQAKNMLVAEFGMTHATLLLCEIADYIAERESP